ncbi:MAG: hypothetical protein JW940_01480 [Polyangiaceae bacterium]|nr:hypothetical protein [Polyangiaceae bacterium]
MDRRHCAIGLGVFIASAVTATWVYAAGPQLRVVYQAPAECPSARVFEQQVQRLRPEVTDASRSSLDVQIERESQGFRGTLRMPESSDASLTRELRSRDCLELVKALALVGAVLIDPDTRARAEAAEPESNAGTPGSGAGSDARPAQRRRSAPATRASAARPAGVPSERVATPSAARWSALVAAAIHVQYGVAPNWALGPRLTAGVRRWAESGWYAVEGRVSVTRTWSGEIERDIGDARMRWTAGRAELCIRFEVGEGAAVSPCGMMELGETSSTGSRAADATTRRALWAAPGGVLRSEIVLLGPWAVLVEAAAARPLVRPHFYFDRADPTAPDDVVYDVPAAAFGAGFGLGAQFP